MEGTCDIRSRMSWFRRWKEEVPCQVKQTISERVETHSVSAPLHPFTEFRSAFHTELQQVKCLQNPKLVRVYYLARSFGCWSPMFAHAARDLSHRRWQSGQHIDCATSAPDSTKSAAPEHGGGHHRRTTLLPHEAHPRSRGSVQPRCHPQNQSVSCDNLYSRKCTRMPMAQHRPVRQKDRGSVVVGHQQLWSSQHGKNWRGYAMPVQNCAREKTRR